MAILAGAPHRATAAELGAELREEAADWAGRESLPVLVVMREQLDLTPFDRGRATAPALIRALREVAHRSQGPLLDLLREKGVEHRSFWIDNSVALRVTPELLAELVRREDVATIDFDVPVRLPELRVEAEDRIETGDTRDSGHTGDRDDEGARSTDWNMDIVRAPEVWSVLELDGTGIVIGSMDTGADITHPALAGKWRGGSNSWFDVQNGLPDPYDDHGHGTHTIGTLVGGDGPGPFVDDIGLAYNARFISAKVLDASNSFSAASIVIAGAQWMLDPDDDPETDDFPHVINNSWFFSSPTYSGFYGTVSAWKVAGIIPVFCIGNNGPAASTTRPPGNYNNLIGVGATTSADEIAVLSSRGPSPTGFVFPADQRKPDLSAPGEDVRSSLPGGFYAAWTGTSMATPHVAATAALFLQEQPTASYETVLDALLDTAVDRGAVGYDYAFGYGRLDAYEALLRASAGAEGQESGVLQRPVLSASPNPFVDRTHVIWSSSDVMHATGARLEIFDLLGRRIRSFAPSARTGSIVWDGRDANGREVASGVYLVRLAGAGAGSITGSKAGASAGSKASSSAGSDATVRLSRIR